MLGFSVIFFQRILEDDIVLGGRARSADNIFIVYGDVFDCEFSSDYWVLGVDNYEWIFVWDSEGLGYCGGEREFRRRRGALHAEGAESVPAARTATEERDSPSATQSDLRPAGLQNRFFRETDSYTLWAAEHHICCKYC